MSALSGFINYSSGDSEISDEEDEYTSKLVKTPPSGLVSSGLGIPHLRTLSTDYISEFSVPIVQSAPLVSYGPDDDHDMHRDSISSHLDDSAVVAQDESGSFENEKDDESDETADTSVEDDTSYLSKYTVTLPPEPTGTCSKTLQDKVIQILEKKRKSGINPTANIMRRKDFRNPSIYDKLVQFLGLDEFGTNYPKERFDPHEWMEESHYDHLGCCMNTLGKTHTTNSLRRGYYIYPFKLQPSKAQKEHHEKKERAKLARTQIDFVGGSATKRPIPAVATNPDVKRQRKSKWDQHVTQDSRPSSKGNSPEPKVGAQALANAAQLNVELNKLGNR